MAKAFQQVKNDQSVVEVRQASLSESIPSPTSDSMPQFSNDRSNINERPQATRAPSSYATVSSEAETQQRRTSEESLKSGRKSFRWWRSSNPDSNGVPSTLSSKRNSAISTVTSRTSTDASTSERAPSPTYGRAKYVPKYAAAGFLNTTTPVSAGMRQMPRV